MTTTVQTESEVDKAVFYAKDGILTPRDLVEINNSCLAKWHYRYNNPDEEENDRSRLGAAAHSIMLSPDQFQAKYMRMPSKGDYESGQLLSSIKDLQGWLATAGVPGRSAKDAMQLVAMITEHCAIAQIPEPFMWHKIEAEAADIGRNYRMIKGEDYDAVVNMRSVIMANDLYSHMILNGEGPFYITTELAGVPVKVKLEKVIDNCIWDYTTTSDASPEFFKNNRRKVGADITTSIMYQAYKKAFGKYPDAINTLAQEKTAPFIPEYFASTGDQLKLGNHQLRSLLTVYSVAREKNIWPTYSGGKVNLFDVPDWVKKKPEFKDIFSEGDK